MSEISILSANTKKGQALENEDGLVATLRKVEDTGNRPNVLVLQELLQKKHTDNLRRKLAGVGFDVIEFSDGNTITPGGLAIAIDRNRRDMLIAGSVWKRSIMNPNSRLAKEDVLPFWYKAKDPIVARDAAGIELTDDNGVSVAISTAHPHPPFGVPGYLMWKNETARLGGVLNDQVDVDTPHIFAGDVNVFGDWMRGTFRDNTLDIAGLAQLPIAESTHIHEKSGWKGKPDVIAYKGLEPVGIRTVPLAGSDHRAVFSRFK